MSRVLSEAEQGLLDANWKTHTSGLLCWFGSLKAVPGEREERSSTEKPHFSDVLVRTSLEVLWREAKCVWDFEMVQAETHSGLGQVGDVRV